jgi:hypothetical protein
MLFPFNAGTWFSLGFMFFLQSCLDGGGTPNFNIPSGGGGGGGSGGSSSPRSTDPDTANSIADLLHRLGSSAHHANGDYDPFARLDAGVIVAVVLGVLVLAIPFVLLAQWLGARGQMMSIRAIATGQNNISEAWNATASTAGRLFRFHAAMFGIGALVFLPILGVGALAIAPKLSTHEPEAALSAIPMLVGLGFFIFVAAIPFMLVGSMARNFVAPLMFKYDLGARDGWKMFWSAARAHVGQIAVFLVLRMVFGAIAGIVAMLATVLTCCIGALPVVHQTIMAPYFVFERAWGLSVLASLGPDFDLTQGGSWGIKPPMPPTGFGGPTAQGPAGYGGPQGYGGPTGYGPPNMPPAGGFGGPRA